VGELFSLAAALVWAGAVILFKKSGETVSPYALNLFRVGISCILFVITLLAMGDSFWDRAPLGDYLILFASGIIAIAISDTLFHMCLNIVGAGINAIVDCLYSPSVLIFAYFLVGERVGAQQFAGMALIILGVFVAARHTPPADLSSRRLVIGVVYGVLSMATLGFGIVIAKPVLNRSPVIWAAAMRQIGCLAAMLLIALISPRRKEILSVFRPSGSWRFSLPGTVLGSFLALIMWIGGMKYAKASIAAILNQTTTIYILIFASLFLGETFTRRKAVAAALAVGGIVMVILG
jgi:drug/metabolite transporter (DMT)-like permease